VSSRLFILFISGAINVHLIDSNSESDEEMSNTTAKVMNKCLIRRRTSQMIPNRNKKMHFLALILGI
jgi:hypothetical protein